MQIRLTVLGPRSGRAARACDVLITAPAGTALGAVAGALASAAGSGQPGRSAGSSVVLYAGAERLAPTAALGVPPLVDGALVSLHGPAEQQGDHGQYGRFGQYGRPPADVARLHVVGGPDAGGVHLLPGGQARIGRSADADVPLDDPDVSRLHCEVVVDPDGEVTVADLGSTNGSALAGRPVGPDPVPLPPGALLRIGETTLRLAAPGAPAPAPLPTAPDADGHLRVSVRDTSWPAEARPAADGAGPGPGAGAPAARVTGAAGPGPAGGPPADGAVPGAGAAPDAAAAHPAAPGDGTDADGGPRATGGSSAAGGPSGAEPPAVGGSPQGTTVTGWGAAPAGAAGPGRAHAGAVPAGPPPDPGPDAAGAAYDAASARERTDGAGAAPGRPAGPGAPPAAPPAPGTHPQAAAGAGPRDAEPGAAGAHDGTTGRPPGAAWSGTTYGTGDAATETHDGRDGIGPGAGAHRTVPGRPADPGAAPGTGGPAGAGPQHTDPAWRPEGAGDRDTFGRGLERPPEAGAGDAPGRGGVVGAIGAWARRRLGGGGRPEATGTDAGEADALRERWPDPAAVLLTVLGPGRRLWERGPAHPDALTVRLGTADLPSEDGTRRLAGVPFTVDLRARRTSALTLAGPRPRLAGLARAVLAQLCALHSPAALELVLLSADRARAADQRAEEWSWLNWVPHLRPAHGQDCRLLLAFDRDQAEARTAELVRRLEAGPLGAGWTSATEDAVAAAAATHAGPFTVVVVDGDPGSAALREAVARIAVAGPSVGVHVLCLAESGEQPAVACGVVARLSGDVATTLRIEPAALSVPGASSAPRVPGVPAEAGDPDEIVLDAVSAAWAEHFARALAPLREADADSRSTLTRHALPATVRLLDELDLALATPAKIAARWADAPATAAAATAVLGVGAAGRVAVDLVREGPHALVGGAPGAGKTELLRSVAAALAAGERPDRLALVLIDGAGTERGGEGLRSCADLPHVSTHLVASDPVRMREFARALVAELKRRADLLDGQEFGAWHADRLVSATVPRQGGRGGRAGTVQVQPPALPRLVVVVDDLDALVAPGLGSPGRPAAGSVVRALEAVARDGERLGVHLVASTGRPERTAGTEADERARVRIALRMPDPESAALLVHVEDPAGLDDALPGRGYLRRPGGAVTAFQAGRVSGRIPRTATLRPTVVPLEWERMGDPPARRQVRELGNGPTDLALLASALQRAAEPTAAGPDPAADPAAGATPLI